MLKMRFHRSALRSFALLSSVLCSDVLLQPLMLFELSLMSHNFSWILQIHSLSFRIAQFLFLFALFMLMHANYFRLLIFRDVYSGTRVIIDELCFSLSFFFLRMLLETTRRRKFH